MKALDVIARWKTIYGVSKEYKIPYVTLYSRIKGNRGSPTDIPITM